MRRLWRFCEVVYRVNQTDKGLSATDNINSYIVDVRGDNFMLACDENIP